MKEWNEMMSKETAELVRELKAGREKLRDLRFRVSQGSHKDVREIREMRTRVARLLTILRSRPGASVTGRSSL